MVLTPGRPGARLTSDRADLRERFATIRRVAPLRIAVLVKQIPAFENMELGTDGRLVRDGVELEMNPYCRRAVAQAVALVAEHGGGVTVITLGPPPAEDSLREAIAWGLDRGVEVDGVLVTDAAFAGSDTLATARAIVAAIDRVGPFDLVLTGRNSVDADTGQVPPAVAELTGLAFLTGVRHISIDGDRVVRARCEHDDGWLEAEVRLPVVLSTAERLIEPAKVDPTGRAAVAPQRVRQLNAADLGLGPWGEAASRTVVGTVRVIESARRSSLTPNAPLPEQVRRAVDLLETAGALDPTGNDNDGGGGVVAATGTGPARLVGVLVEPDRDALTRELLGAAAALGGDVHAIAPTPADPARLGGWGADVITRLRGSTVEEDVARGITRWAQRHQPWVVLAPGTVWGREVASRCAAALDAGLVGDAVELDGTGSRLVAWKPAFGGALVAAITVTSPIQLVTVRAGVLPKLRPRPAVARLAEDRIELAGRVRIVARTRDDDLDALADARTVVGVGQGVDRKDHPALDPLLDVLGAQLAATRKVTDQGWLPRARQVGITGRSIAPRLYVAIGLSGKFNHMVGVRAATTVLAINDHPDAPVFDCADMGIVGDWHEVVPLLVDEIAARGAKR